MLRALSVCVSTTAKRPAIAPTAQVWGLSSSHCSGLAVAGLPGRSLVASPALRFYTQAAADGGEAAAKGASPQEHDGQGVVVVVTSGKGGVGKTTTSASFGYGLAERGYKTVVIDFDIGLRNLDLHLGMERRVVFDFVNVINGDAKLKQALIRDRQNENLYLLAASQTRDKTALTHDGVAEVLAELRSDFDFIVCDSPAGIESGAQHAMYFADEAVVCTNPELSSVRDSDKMIGILAGKSQRAELGLEPMRTGLLVTRYDVDRVADANMLSVDDIAEMLGLSLYGVIPESKEVLESTNLGRPVIVSESDCAEAYKDFVSRFLGEDVPLRFTTPKPKGILSRFFG